MHFQRLSEMTDLKNAVSNMEMAAALAEYGHPEKLMYRFNLDVTQQICYQHFVDLSDLESVILNEERALEQMDDRHLDKPKYLSNLSRSQELRFHRLEDLADLENVISNEKKPLSSRIVPHHFTNSVRFARQVKLSLSMPANMGGCISLWHYWPNRTLVAARYRSRNACEIVS